MLSLILLDVDYFKRYNDRYGHAAGDDCLSAVGAAISQAVTRPEDLAARYGGEEFTVLLPNTDQAGAALVAEDILGAIRALSIEHSNHPLGHVTASAGIAVCQPAEVDIAPADLVNAADKMLYLAKENGRDRYCTAANNDNS